MTKPRQYVVISPVRNEEQYISLTIASMLAQTITPTQWIIVNDGSSDATGRIATAAAATHSWIQVVNRPDRGVRRAGGGVVEAFYDGFRALTCNTWQYLVKLDGDLSFQPDYFERCFTAFEGNSGLGITGGTVCCRAAGGSEVEFKNDPLFHVRGATKIYERTCWDAIGGLLEAPGWDTLDEVKANMLGWRTCTLPDIEILHHRPTGAAYGDWNDRVKSGTANYITGYHPLFMFLKCIRRLTERPYIIGAFALLWGFIKGYIKQLPQVEDKELIRYLRREQLNRLLARKSLWG